MRIVLFVATVSLLGACATGADNSYRAELERLEQSCEDQGGTLRASAAAGRTGQATADYVCDIRDASRLEPRG
jgi:hypothetical protein